MEIILALFTILGGISALWFFWDKLVIKKPQETPVLVQNKADPSNSIKIEEYYNDLSFKTIRFVNCDLANNDQNNEIIIHSHNGKNEYVDVFSLKGGVTENLFHYKANFDDEVNCYVHSFNNKNYFIFTTRAGSGGFLHFSIYSYDNTSKLNLCKHIKNLYQGSLFLIPERILLSGNGKKFEIYLKNNNSFNVKPIKVKLLNSISDSSHIISFRYVKQNFITLYDGNHLSFINMGINYVTQIPIKIELCDQIYVDDNVESSSQLAFKLLVDDHFYFINGFYYTIKPVKRGKGVISIRFEESWYNIEFVID